MQAHRPLVALIGLRAPAKPHRRGPNLPTGPRIKAYVETLLDRWPDIEVVGNEVINEDSPWSVGNRIYAALVALRLEAPRRRGRWKLTG
jgi:hypothetical protein